MTELNMYPTRSFVRVKATNTYRIPSGGVSYAPFRHFVLLKKYIVYGQGPIACGYGYKRRQHAVIQKVLSEGSNFYGFFVF